MEVSGLFVALARDPHPIGTGQLKETMADPSERNAIADKYAQQLRSLENDQREDDHPRSPVRTQGRRAYFGYSAAVVPLARVTWAVA